LLFVKKPGIAELVALQKRRKEGCNMKKLMFVTVLLLLASPALARVDITADANGGTVYVYYSMPASDTNLPRAFGLDITCKKTAGSNVNEPNILSIGDLNPDFNIYPGSIVINTDGIITDLGTPVNSDQGLAGPNDSNGMTVELASLYAPVTPGSPNAPPSSGLLFSFVVDRNCTVNISGNAARGNVVMESLSISADPNYGAATVVCACSGDVDDNGWITLTDVLDVYGLILANGGNSVPRGNVNFKECADMDYNDWITLTDVLDVYGIYLANGGASVRTLCQIPMQ
jgi:hypothetical protein